MRKKKLHHGTQATHAWLGQSFSINSWRGNKCRADTLTRNVVRYPGARSRRSEQSLKIFRILQAFAERRSSQARRWQIGSAIAPSLHLALRAVEVHDVEAEELHVSPEAVDSISVSAKYNDPKSMWRLHAGHGKEDVNTRTEGACKSMAQMTGHWLPFSIYLDCNTMFKHTATSVVRSKCL